MNHTFGYILCCQSPALFLLAIALVIRFFICKGRAKFRAVLSLIGGLVCIALGVVLYYQGLVREHFAVRDFWHIRIPGWIGLALMAALLIYLSLRAFLRFSARRSEQKKPSGPKMPAVRRWKRLKPMPMKPGGQKPCPLWFPPLQEKCTQRQSPLPR